MSIKQRVAQVLYKVNPYWDEIPWNRQRDKEMRAAGVATHSFKSIAPFEERPVHVLVVPQHGPSDQRYAPGERNFYYEAEKLLSESLGASHVSVFEVGENEEALSWVPRLVREVFELRITHILTHIEIDPGNQIGNWNWDTAFATLLEHGWDGVLLGVNFDSAFKWIRAKSRRLARMSPQFLAVDICVSLDGELVPTRVEVGPVNMPISHQSLELIDEALSSVEKSYDVSFIGVLYPYRVELIDELRRRGIEVAVNPHRPDVMTDPELSRVNQPSWLNYMRGLARSRMTINFSKSSAGPYEQLKTRVIEATLAGTYLLTDDKMSTSRFFELDQYSYFESVDELPNLIESLLSENETLIKRSLSAQARARELAVSDFWHQIDQGLVNRELPRIFAQNAD